MLGGRRERAQRLEAPRSWLPRWRARGLFRLGVVCALLLTAAAVLLFDPSDRARQPSVAQPSAAQPSAAQRGRPSTPCGAPSGGPPRGTVGFPLRLADPAVLAVVRAGSRVDILALGDTPGALNKSDIPLAATVVAADLPVLRTVGTAGGADGVLYLAASPRQAAALAAIGASAKVSVTVRAPG